MNGVLIVDKETGMTSFSVISRLRKILNQKKIGHAGTLDPNATGVLPILLGQATRLNDRLHGTTKTYIAEVLFGSATDTEDVWGTVTEEREVHLSEEEIRKAILSFEGSYFQEPPMYSAKKVQGEKLCNLARKGVIKERKAVEVFLSDLQILEIGDNKAKFQVTCSKGTYIRTLCKDIGKALEVPACMSSLRRIRHGEFRIEKAIKLEEIRELAEQGELNTKVIPLDHFFDEAETLRCTTTGEKLLNNGNTFSSEYFSLNFETVPSIVEGREYKLYDSQNRFQAVYRYDSKKEALVPRYMFLTKEEFR